MTKPKPRPEVPPTIGAGITGTLVSPRKVIVNKPLITIFQKQRIKRVALIGNEPGIAMHLKAGDPRFPSPELFMMRLLLLLGELQKARIDVAGVYVSLWHPAVTNPQWLDVAKERLEALNPVERFFFKVDVLVSTLPGWRKPSPEMLQTAGVAEYYGHSLEDASAAQAAGVVFRKVERFDTGGEHGDHREH